MKTNFLLLVCDFLVAFANAGGNKDTNDGCAALCRAVKGAPKDAMNIWSPICAGLSGNFCEKHCSCDRNSKMACDNKGLSCSKDAVTKTCIAGFKGQWECWCQNLFALTWGPDSKKCGKN